MAMVMVVVESRPGRALRVALLVVGGLTWFWAACVTWLVEQAAGWLCCQRAPSVSVIEAAVVAVRLPWHLDDPRQAWPQAAQAGLPGPVGMYATVFLLAAVAMAAVAGLCWCGARIRQAGRQSLEGAGLRCPRGHALTAENSARDVSGAQRCLVCGQRAWRRQRRARRWARRKVRLVRWARRVLREPPHRPGPPARPRRRGARAGGRSA